MLGDLEENHLGSFPSVEVSLASMIDGLNLVPNGLIYSPLRKEKDASKHDHAGKYQESPFWHGPCK